MPSFIIANQTRQLVSTAKAALEEKLIILESKAEKTLETEVTFLTLKDFGTLKYLGLKYDYTTLNSPVIILPIFEESKAIYLINQIKIPDYVDTIETNYSVTIVYNGTVIGALEPSYGIQLFYVKSTDIFYLI